MGCLFFVSLFKQTAPCAGVAGVLCCFSLLLPAEGGGFGLLCCCVMLLCDGLFTLLIPLLQHFSLKNTQSDLAMATKIIRYPPNKLLEIR